MSDISAAVRDAAISDARIADQANAELRMYLRELIRHLDAAIVMYSPDSQARINAQRAIVGARVLLGRKRT